jgi:hypothetical protein
MCREKGLGRPVVYTIAQSILRDAEKELVIKEKKALMVCYASRKNNSDKSTECHECNKKIYYSESLHTDGLIRHICPDCAVANHQEEFSEKILEMIKRMAD